MDEKILNLSRDHAIVRAAISRHYGGYCTYEEALELMVVALCESNSRLIEQSSQLLMNSPATLIISHGDIIPRD